MGRDRGNERMGLLGNPDSMQNFYAEYDPLILRRAPLLPFLRKPELSRFPITTSSACAQLVPWISTKVSSFARMLSSFPDR